MTFKPSTPEQGTQPQTAVQRPEDRAKPRFLLPLLIGLVVVIVASIVYFIAAPKPQANTAKGTQPAATANADSSTEDGSSSASSDSDAMKDGQSQAAPADSQNMAQPITDERTRKLALSLPRRQADDPRAMGPVDAPVVFMMWEDFACPMCTRFELNSFPDVKKMAQEGKIRIEWHDLAIFAGQYKSDLAAAGSRAAANQGKFWEFVEAAYHTAGEGNHPTYTEQTPIEIAKQIGIPDMAKFEKDYKDPATRDAVQKETEEAAQMGLNGTPAFIINDAFIGGAYPTDYFINTINDRLKAAKK